MFGSPVAGERRLVDEPSITRALQSILMGALSCSLAISIVTVFLGWPLVSLLSLVAAAGTLAAVMLGRRGRVRAGIFLACAGVCYAVMHAAAAHDGIQNVGLTILPVLIVVASLLIDGLSLLFFTAAVILAAAAMVVIRADVLRVEPYDIAELGDFFIFSVTCVAAALVGRLLAGRNHEGFQQVRASEQRYRRIFDNIQDVYYEMRPDGVLLELSPAAAELFGTPVDRLLGRSLASLCDDRAAFEGLCASLREHGYVSNRELSIRTSRGRLIHVLVNSRLQDGPGTGECRTIGTIRDITDGRRAEEALRVSEERLRLAADVTGAGTFDFDPLTGKLVWSEITKRQFGMSPDAEVTYERALAAVHPDDRARVAQLNRSLALPATGGRLATEYRVIGVEDGQERWLAVRGRMLFDPLGRPTRLIGTTIDITERKRLEEELRRRVEELQTIMNVAPVALFTAHDPECQTVTVNRAGNALLGLPLDANSRDDPGGFAPPCPFFRDGVQIAPEDLPLQTAARGVEVRDYEAEALLPGGDRRIVWGHASPLHDAAGRVRGAIAAVQDVTDARLLAEARLRESEERFREAADAAPVIMWLSDPDSRLIFANEQFVRFTGLPAEQLLGEGWAQVLHPDDLEGARAIYRAGVNGRATYQIEYRARRSDGEYRHMLGSTRPRHIRGEYAGQIGTVVDITDLKLRQQQDIARQKLESVGMLASGIAHDFNNLLGSVLAQSELAIAEVGEGRAPDVELKRIGDLAARGSEIVRQLMIYAGIESEAPVAVDVSRTVEDMLELIGVSLSKRASVQADLAAGLPPVQAEAAQVRQIVMNLVTNASEALGDAEGVIRIRTERVAVQANTPVAGGKSLAGEGYIQLTVSDSGCGLSAEAQARIFDPFFTTKSAGRGLGLAVVQGIVRSLGGSIRVASRPGAGATFRVLLPCAQIAPREATPAEPRAAAPAARNDVSILIVEDESLLRQAVAKMLARDGYSVVEAGDGDSALAAIRTRAGSLDAVLLDVTIPGASSAEVFDEARRLSPATRVIATSAYSASEAVASLPGVGHFIRKPYRLTELAQLIRQTMSPL